MLQDTLGPLRWAARPGTGPAQDREVPWQLPLRSVQRAVAAACAGLPQGGWWLQFGPDPGAVAPVDIRALRVAGVLPWGLAGVQLWHHGQVVYQLDSSSDARGNPLLAGDMLQAMARMQGHDALLVDAHGLGLAPGATALRLLLTADAHASVAQARVSLLPR